MNWILKVDDCGVVILPPDLLKATGWSEGTVIEWGVEGDVITAKTYNQDQNE